MRRGLTREAIVEAAMRVLERDGSSALSMRRLAAELDVGTMTLYGHFAGKEELLEAVVETAAPALPATPTTGSWRTRLRALMVTLHDELVEHPAFVELRLQRPIVTPAALDVTERAMALLGEGGFPPDAAARAYRALFVYVFGSVAFAHPSRGAEERAATRRALAALERERYPALLAAAAEAEQAMGDAGVFEHGLEALLRGLRP